MNAIRILVGALALASAACAPVAPKPDPPKLAAARIGTTVALTGRFSGPAKIADFVRIDDDIVYLPDLARSPRPPYGTTVVVRGVLRHFDPPPEACTPGPGCFDAVPPAYWYLEHARIEAVMAREAR